MVNFIKASKMSDLDFAIWLAEHPKYIPKNPNADTNFKDVVNANMYFSYLFLNRYAYAISAFIFLGFILENVLYLI